MSNLDNKFLNLINMELSGYSLESTFVILTLHSYQGMISVIFFASVPHL